ERTATLTIADQPVVVTQAALACTFVVTPETLSFPAAGGSAVVSVAAAAAECGWTAASEASWVVVSDAEPRTGDGAVHGAVAAHPGSSRTATLMVTGHPVIITQNRAPTIQLSPVSLSVGVTVIEEQVRSSLPQLLTITQTTGAPLAWTARSDSDWLTVSP